MKVDAGTCCFGREPLGFHYLILRGFQGSPHPQSLKPMPSMELKILWKFELDYPSPPSEIIYLQVEKAGN